MADLAIVLFGRSDLAVALGEATGLPTATAEAAEELASAAAVVGLGTEPWPSFAVAHERVRDRLGGVPYYAVQAWHQHPAYLDALVGALRTPLAAAPEGTHVLFTAPGPAAEPDPSEVVFLREVAEAVSGELAPARRSIAWVGGAMRPSTATVLSTLRDAHDRTTVLRVSLDPLGRPDGVHAEASAAGIDLAEVRLSADALPTLLAAVVGTVAEHEGLGGDRDGGAP